MAVSFVNSATANNSASDTTIALAATSLTAGNFIFGAVGWDSTNTTVSSITDTAGNTYTIGTLRVGGAFNDMYITPFWCFDALGDASNVVTATLNAAATFRRIATAQYSGLGAGTLEDEDVFIVDNGDVAVTDYETPALTLTGEGVIIGVAAPYSSRTMVPGGAYTERNESADTVGLLDQISASGTTDTVDLVFSGTTFGVLIGLAFKAAASTSVKYNMMKGM